MKPKLGLVAPYPDLVSLSCELAREFDKNIIVKEGDLSEGVRLAKEMEESGVEVIVSRGGTALVIKNQVTIPVVEIRVTGFDILRALFKARKAGKKVGIVGFKNIIYGSESLGEILGIKLVCIPINSEKEVVGKLLLARKQEVDIIVGDNIVVSKAKEHNIRRVLIESGKEAVLMAIEEAERVALVKRRESERTQQFKTILDSSYEGIISTDSEGMITVFNPKAEEITGRRFNEVKGRNISEIVPEIKIKPVLKEKESVLGDLEKIKDLYVVIDCIPILVKNEVFGAVATIQPLADLQSTEQKARKKLYMKGHVARYTFADIIGNSKIMREIVAKALKFASTKSTILITGETGTGKERFAQSIHNASQQRTGPFVAINCSTLPESLLESELFGYEEGAFTGAKRGGKPGLFELAHRGTIFLDEIAELPLLLQARLLRVIQEREVMRIGGDKVIPVMVRIIAATNRDIGKLVKQGRFRQDLYYRLNVLHLHIPPLRERKEDIMVLTDYFCRNFTNSSNYQHLMVSPEVKRILLSYEWSGNVRELFNLMERICVLTKGLGVSQQTFINLISEEISKENVLEFPSTEVALKGTLKEMERQIMEKIIDSEGRSKSDIAKRLGISRTTLWRKIKEISN